MKMKYVRFAALILLAAVCLFVSVAASPIGASDIDHDCLGEGCAACLCLIAGEHLSGAALLPTALFALFALPTLPKYTALCAAEDHSAPHTPVLLKVKLSN